VIARRAVGAGFVTLVAALTAVGGAGAQVESLSVEADRTEISTGLGSEFGFRTTITNRAATATPALIAHLNILSLRGDVYVDPEDWSPRRTQYVDVLAPGDTADVSWNVQAVTSGPLILFVSVTSLDGDQVVSSGPLRMTVHGQRVVDSTRVLPLVLWTPAAVLVLLGATLVRRRRHR
jgi:hypothetical protein